MTPRAPCKTLLFIAVSAVSGACASGSQTETPRGPHAGPNAAASPRSTPPSAKPTAKARAAGGKGSASTAPPSTGSGPGQSLEDPVMLCGPSESYRFVAEKFTCPDGENPLGGSVERAQGARVGTVNQPKNGHIVDVYRIPCKDGEISLYVDMYGCAEFAQQLDQKEPTEAAKKLVGDFDKHDYRAVLGQCSKAARELETDELMYCMVLVPASFAASGANGAAVVVMQEECSKMPPASSVSNARASLVLQVSSAVARAAMKNGHGLDNEDGMRMVAAFAEACDVGPKDIERVLDIAETM